MREVVRALRDLTVCEELLSEMMRHDGIICPGDEKCWHAHGEEEFRGCACVSCEWGERHEAVVVMSTRER